MPLTGLTAAHSANMQALQNWNSRAAYNAAQAQNQMNFQYQSAQEAMAFSAAEAQKNRDWQERMRNTAYQRAVKDLKDAGLNPILAYQNGGASNGSGSSAQGVAMSGASGQTSAAQTFMNNGISEMLQVAGSTANFLYEITSKLPDAIADLLGIDKNSTGWTKNGWNNRTRRGGFFKD